MKYLVLLMLLVQGCASSEKKLMKNCERLRAIYFTCDEVEE